MTEAREYLRRGVPFSLRGRLWRVALGLSEETNGIESAMYDTLRRSCDQLDLLTDELFLHDVQIVTDDVRFFVFEDELKLMSLCFSRDEWIRENAVYQVCIPIYIYTWIFR
jgi:hypothetical protein